MELKLNLAILFIDLIQVDQIGCQVPKVMTVEAVAYDHHATTTADTMTVMIVTTIEVLGGMSKIGIIMITIVLKVMISVINLVLKTMIIIVVHVHALKIVIAVIAPALKIDYRSVITIINTDINMLVTIIWLHTLTSGN